MSLPRFHVRHLAFPLMNLIRLAIFCCLLGPSYGYIFFALHAYTCVCIFHTHRSLASCVSGMRLCEEVVLVRQSHRKKKEGRHSKQIYAHWLEVEEKRAMINRSILGVEDI